MNTFLKILLGLVLLVLAFKFAPVLMLPFGLLAAGLLLAWVTVSLTVAGLFAVALVVVAALAPVWLPVLAIVGLIALCRGGARRTAA